ncbi:fibroblast growth factor 8b-like isoform X2 [Dendronephthya gigantea]|uniref:fibroblast growth factor 8b-like isoform X2 n=1 Tax=Dendronephthya gigantea TaxID=151771 RepID=UPI00106A7B46|nr:fibroblast growth factor 8b-like isoform X2 [Dendronephthya gigantea]
MRVYGSTTASFYTYLLLILARTETSDILGKHYDVQRQKTDKTTPSYSKTVQLYSKASSKYVQVLGRTVNASADAKSDAAKLIVESDTFGKVRIRHYKSNYYICLNVKGETAGLAEKKGKHVRRCVFRPRFREDGYIQFISDKYGRKKNVSRYLAFRGGGEPKVFSKVFGENQHATKFLMYMLKSKKRHVKRNIRRHLMKHEFPLEAKKRRKDRRNGKICKRYIKCMRQKNWRNLRRGEIIKLISRCRRLLRRKNCRCKCAEE